MTNQASSHARVVAQERFSRAAYRSVLAVGFILTGAAGLVSAATHIVTNTNDSGPGSLRDAIHSANAGDLIVCGLPPGSTITLVSGELAITAGLTIQGSGASALTISGNHASRIFNVTSATSVTISGLTLRDGAPSSDAYGGGAILVNGGAGVAPFNLTDSIVTNNDVTVALNSVGGGIDNEGGTVTITRSSIVNNVAAYRGGGVQNQGFGSMTIVNSTIANNTAGPSGTGGGIRSLLPMTLTDCTIYGNSAQTAGNASAFAAGTIGFQNTIIAGGILLGNGGIGPDINGNFDSFDNNLIQDPASGTISGATAHNITGLSPVLGPLGGTPPVLAPQAESPVLRAGTAVAGVTVDERGLPRSPANPDIGAVEVQSASAPVAAPALSASRWVLCALMIMVLACRSLRTRHA